MNIKNKYTVNACSIFSLCLALSCNNTNQQHSNDIAAGSTAAPTEASQQAEPQAAPMPPASADPAPSIPNFTFYELKSGIRFNKEDLAKGGNVTFILFDPSCSHCQREAGDLGRNYDRIKNDHIYFVSMNDPALMSTFLDTFAKPLVGKDNITVLYDRNADFINYFHIPSQYPASYVYGADGQLKEHWSGDRNIDEIIKAIQQ